ncbi:glutamate--cysteine ligase [Rickettsiales bacterium]|nr:glutamate--cysteine ligase [Rickettsiales bacterium]MDB2550438.1 glutamate--cysteine ligase [Rickettsiales bacterium]
MNHIHQILINKISSKQSQISDWFAEKLQNANLHFYNSVDIRHFGHKIAPVDNNCFPAGFNHLSNDSRKIATIKAKSYLNNNFPKAQKILILAEAHTKNLRYLENILSLQNIIQNAGFEVQIANLNIEITDILEIDLANNQKIKINKLIRKNDRITTLNGFDPDLIISNNDFTDGIADILSNIEQKIIPNPNFGWFVRSKSEHFKQYNLLATEFANLIDIDPWLISTKFNVAKGLNFKQQIGIDDLVIKTADILKELQEKYQQYNINSNPYCFIKADNGTYGMAIMTVSSADELVALNKKNRNKMNMLKGNVQNHQVIIQEGVPTIDKIKNFNAEPMIYMVGGEVVGNLFRYNQARDEKNNLNSGTMEFSDLNILNDSDINLGAARQEVVKIYDIIARISALAATMEKY